VVNGETPDPSIRPRQVIAVSLTNSMLSKDRATSVLPVVERELLTPRGYGLFHRTIRITLAVTKAIRAAVMEHIINAPSGPG